MRYTLRILLTAALATAGCAVSEDRFRRALSERRELLAQIEREAATIQRLENELAQRGVEYPATDPALLARPGTAPGFARDDLDRSASSALPWVLVGVGAAAIAGSAGTWAAASAKEGELDESCSAPNANATRLCDGNLKSVRESGENLLLTSYILGIAGGASAALGITLFAIHRGSSPARVSANCSGTGCTFAAGGAF